MRYGIKLQNYLKFPDWLASPYVAITLYSDKRMISIRHVKVMKNIIRCCNANINLTSRTVRVMRPLGSSRWAPGGLVLDECLRDMKCTVHDLELGHGFEHQSGQTLGM